MDGWNPTFILGRPIFRGYVSFREGIFWIQLRSIGPLFSATPLQKWLPQSAPRLAGLGTYCVLYVPGTCSKTRSLGTLCFHINSHPGPLHVKIPKTWGSDEMCFILGDDFKRILQATPFIFLSFNLP